MTQKVTPTKLLLFILAKLGNHKNVLYVGLHIQIIDYKAPQQI